MAKRASARLAARLRSSADGMPASTGSCPTGEGCKHPVIIIRGLTSNRLLSSVCFYPKLGHSIRRSRQSAVIIVKKKKKKQTNKHKTFRIIPKTAPLLTVSKIILKVALCHQLVN